MFSAKKFKAQNPNTFNEPVFTTSRFTYLHVAICEGNDQAVKEALAEGFDPNVQDASGNTPLHLAVIYNNLQYVALLLNNPNTDILIKNKQGKMAQDLIPKKGKKIISTKLLHPFVHYELRTLLTDFKETIEEKYSRTTTGTSQNNLEFFSQSSQSPNNKSEESSDEDVALSDISSINSNSSSVFEDDYLSSDKVEDIDKNENLHSSLSKQQILHRNKQNILLGYQESRDEQLSTIQSEDSQLAIQQLKQPTTPNTSYEILKSYMNYEKEGFFGKKTHQGTRLYTEVKRVLDIYGIEFTPATKRFDK